MFQFAAAALLIVLTALWAVGGGNSAGYYQREIHQAMYRRSKPGRKAPPL